MIKRIFLIASLLVSTGCNDTETEKPTTLNNNGKSIIIKVIIHDSYHDVNIAYREMFPNRPTAKKLGWAGWNEAGTLCQIHVVDFKDAKDPVLNTWGHELGHCVYGSWHPE